ncbi:cytochrome P450 1A1-like [Ostrea edulis]|uniref:cytochrome P450 1A1-like n=1 Tax=Ostrea edulis TaxID=37623 RepID=UPI0024AF01BF|nr:cytochrome P450 1A1-like [Ostrea edulis]
MDTTTNALRWVFLFLMHHPDIQDRMCTEIEGVVRRDMIPMLEDRSKLPFCEAVCFEVMRLGKGSPHTAPHTMKQDTEINGCVIPKGVPVVFNLNSINSDPEIFPDPSTFNPDRFLTGDGRLQGTEKMATSSMGRRSCMGESLAMMELFLFVMALVQRYKIKIEP